MPSPTRNLALNRGMCPDWEINQQSLGFWNDAQPTYPYQPGLFLSFLSVFWTNCVDDDDDDDDNNDYLIPNNIRLVVLYHAIILSISIKVSSTMQVHLTKNEYY